MRTFAVLWWRRKTHQVGLYKGLMSAVAEQLFSMWGWVEEMWVEAAAVNRTRVCAYRTEKKWEGGSPACGYRPCKHIFRQGWHLGGGRREEGGGMVGNRVNRTEGKKQPTKSTSILSFVHMMPTQVGAG